MQQAYHMHNLYQCQCIELTVYCLHQTAANSVTGIALWPRLLLSDDVEINSRHFPDGGHQKSHWQTVLPIMSTEPVAVKGGDQIDVSFEFNVGEEVTKPSTYKISGNVISV